MAVRNEILLLTLRRLLAGGARRRLTHLLARVRPEDLAQILPRLTPSQRMQLIRHLIRHFPDSVGDVLIELEESEQLAILEHLSFEELHEFLPQAAIDDAVSLIELLPDERRREVIAGPGAAMANVKAQLDYEDESAGRIMDTDLFTLPDSCTVGEAVEMLRRAGDVENIYYLYVVNGERRLVGVVPLRELLLSQPDRPVREVMTSEVLKVRTGTDQEEVAQLAARYNLLAIPVVDDDDVLVGIVTADDILEVLSEEATEDILKMVGTTDEELIYQGRTWRVAGIRMPWLVITVVGQSVTGFLLTRFQATLSEALFLLAGVPLIMSLGGNIGSQIAAITVRGLATGRLRFEEQWGFLRFVWKQLKVGFVLAGVCACLVAIGAWLLERNAAYAVVVAGAVIFAILLSSITGALIPRLFDRIGIDPAVASGPLVSISNDITGILIYFGLAVLLIGLLVG